MLFKTFGKPPKPDIEELLILKSIVPELLITLLLPIPIETSEELFIVPRLFKVVEPAILNILSANAFIVPSLVKIPP